MQRILGLPPVLDELFALSPPSTNAVDVLFGSDARFSSLHTVFVKPLHERTPMPDLMSGACARG
jgi:hypothetical protein